MRFLHLSVLGLAVIGAHASPVEISRAVKDPGSVAMTHPTLEERQGLNGWRNTIHGVFWFGFSLATAGKDVWMGIYSSCQEMVNNKDVSSGIDCVTSIITTTFHSAVYAVGSYNTAITFMNIARPPQPPTKRDTNGTTDWTSHWNNLDISQRSQLRSELQDVHKDINLHSIGNGSPQIENSISMYLSHGTGDSNSTSTGPYVRHVTNGTHGYIRSVTPTQKPSGQKRDDTWSFSDDIAGLKFSYNHPCMGEQIDDNIQNDDDYLDSIADFVQFSVANPADKYNIEWDDQHTASVIMYGTLVAEANGFGSNYEEPDFYPIGVCITNYPTGGTTGA